MYRPSARAEVVAALIVAGGAVHDKSGLASSELVTALESVGTQRNGRNIAALLLSMERDGLIERDMSGRRTFEIKLSDNVPARLAKAAEGLLFENGWTMTEIADRCAQAGLYSDYESMAGGGAAHALTEAMFGGSGDGGQSNLERMSLVRMLDEEREARAQVERERDELAAEKAELELTISELRERAELIDQVSQLVSGNATSIDKARSRRVS